MAHLIDMTKGQTGAVLSYQKTMWHKLGTIIQEQPKELIDILKPAGLDYIVGKEPNVHFFPDENIEGVYSDISFFTYRKDVIDGKDKYAVLGSHVGAGYHILQNEDVLGIVEPFFDNKDISFETAGALKDGRWSFVCCKFNDPMVIGKNDEVDNYFVIFNSFDGSLAVQAYFTPIRVVCNNTLQMSFRSAKQRITLRHTKNLSDRLHEATKILLAGKENAEVFTEKAKAMKKDNWSEKRFFDYLSNVYCSPSEIRDLSKGVHPLEVLSTRKRNIIASTIDYAYDGVGQQEAGEMSAWWAYNAVTGYYSNEKEFNGEMAKLDSLYFGGSSRILETSLALAQPEAKITPLATGMSLN